MGPSGLQRAWDYNRGVPAWLRPAAIGFDALMTGVFRSWVWTGLPSRRQWARPLLVGVLVGLLLLPLDGMLIELARWIDRERIVGGDVRRVLVTLGEYGQGVWLVLVAIAVWCLHPAGRRRLADLALAVPVLLVLVNAGKMLIGRPRPRDGMADLYGSIDFLGPLGQHPFAAAAHEDAVGVRHAWQILPPADLSDIHSMPSSHTAFAFLLSAFLACAYPAIARLAFVLAVIVAVSRVIERAHWPSDTALGAALGLAVGLVFVRRELGQRLVDAVRRWLGYAPVFRPQASTAA